MTNSEKIEYIDGKVVAKPNELFSLLNKAKTDVFEIKRYSLDHKHWVYVDDIKCFTISDKLMTVIENYVGNKYKNSMFSNIEFKLSDICRMVVLYRANKLRKI